MMTILFITKLTATILNCKRKRRLRASFDIREQGRETQTWVEPVTSHTMITLGDLWNYQIRSDGLYINIAFVAQKFHFSAIQFLLVNTAHE